MTTAGRALTRIFRPRIPGSPPYRLCQSACPRTTVHGARRSGLLLRPREHPPESGLRTHEAKHARGDKGCRQDGRGLYVITDVHAGSDVGRHLAEGLCAVLPIRQVQKRYAGLTSVRIASAQEDDSLVIDGQSAKQRRVHQRERGGRRTEGQRQNEHCPEGVPPILHQRPSCEPQVPLQLVGKPQAARLSDCVLRALDAAEVHLSAARRFRRRYSPAHQVFGVVRQVKPYLLVECVLEAPPPNPVRQERAQAREQRQTSSDAEPRAVVTVAAWHLVSRHFWLSTRSWSCRSSPWRPALHRERRVRQRAARRPPDKARGGRILGMFAAPDCTQSDERRGQAGCIALEKRGLSPRAGTHNADFVRGPREIRQPRTERPS